MRVRSRALSAALASALALVGLGSTATPALADGLARFPDGAGTVWVSSGEGNTQLYRAVQDGSDTKFEKVGEPAGFVYNALTFNPTDMYLYAIQTGGTTLHRIGSDGATEIACPSVTNLPKPTTETGNYNQGTFDADKGVMYVRLATESNVLYSVNLQTCAATKITLKAAVPNVNDLVYSNGYLWAVMGPLVASDPKGLNRLYRIDPAGNVTVVSLASLGIDKNSYGGQWVYGNGHLGILNNHSGKVYELEIVNPNGTASELSVKIVGTSNGPASYNNDAAAYEGKPVDLGIVKSVTPASVVVGDTVKYTLTVTNHGAGASSGFTVSDTLPAGLALSGVLPDDCRLDQGIVECGGGALENGEEESFEFEAVVNTDGLIENTAVVTGHELDTTPENNTDTAEIDAKVKAYTVGKTATTDSEGPVGPGDVVTYTVTVKNIGKAAYTAGAPASFTDDLSAVLDDATYNDDVTGGATVKGSVLSWSGPLGVGETKEFTYTVTVGALGVGDDKLTNTVLPGEGGACTGEGECTTDTTVSGPPKPTPSATVTPAPSPSPSPSPAKTTGGGVLAKTGAEALGLVGLAVVLLGSGAGLLYVRRRRTQS